MAQKAVAAVMTDNLLETIQTMNSQREHSVKARNRRAEVRAGVAVFFFMVAVLVIDYFSAFLPSPPAPSVVYIEDLRATGSTALCPGEMLNYAYRVTGEEAGVLDVDATIWRRTPPQTVVYSTSRRIVLSGSTDYTQQDEWPIPTHDLLTGAVIGWTSGEYERRVSISTPSRNTEPAIASLPFSIREDCE